MPVNPRTGLLESFNDFYKVPLVHQTSLNTLKFHGQPTALHTVPIGNGLTLDFYSKLSRSDELLIAFHGANLAEKNFYPRFERVHSMRSRADSFMAFADPTIMVDTDREMLLSWFLGGPGWDPANAIMKAIRKAIGKTGAKHLSFVGGSGGGFAALRMSAMVPGSLAFIQEPQTNIGRYIPHVVDTYFEKVWPNWDRSKLIDAFPARFNMVDHYKEHAPTNYVYYAQSVADTSHVENHYGPFKEAFGLKSRDGVSPNQRCKFVLYEGAVAGHGKITPAEFDFHFQEAMEYWRANR
ncbi:hypothetical protein ACIPVK_12730 [Paeniglutamicibacter sp. MACA_103]|uniref:hypothetical protein n=1 Tax=Paeniglutamicibacter sp. MACA_103 TaxID=3377337 RepID=UPI003893E23F